jgi:hypothetical protein
LPAGESNDERQQHSRDEYSSQRRRRRRRGRSGGSRDTRRSHAPERESSPPSEDDDLPFLELAPDEELISGDESQIEFAADTSRHADSLEDAEHDSSERTSPVDELDEEDAALSEADDHHSGKSSVRDIVTWKDAIGMIIDANMQTRANTPHREGHDPRGSRGGHGRGGRGRGGRRR